MRTQSDRLCLWSKMSDNVKSEVKESTACLLHKYYTFVFFFFSWNTTTCAENIVGRLRFSGDKAISSAR